MILMSISSVAKLKLQKEKTKFFGKLFVIDLVYVSKCYEIGEFFELVYFTELSFLKLRFSWVC